MEMFLHITRTGRIGMSEKIPGDAVPIVICSQEYCHILLSFLGVNPNDIENTEIIIEEIANARTDSEAAQALENFTMVLASNLLEYLEQKERLH